MNVVCHRIKHEIPPKLTFPIWLRGKHGKSMELSPAIWIFNSHFAYIVCYVESFQIIRSIWLMQIICLFHLTKFSADWVFFYVWSSIFSKLTSTIVFPPDKIYFMYILLNMNGTALVCYPNEMIPTALACETMKMHFMLFICFFFGFFPCFRVPLHTIYSPNVHVL